MTQQELHTRAVVERAAKYTYFYRTLRHELYFSPQYMQVKIPCKLVQHIQRVRTWNFYILVGDYEYYLRCK